MPARRGLAIFVLVTVALTPIALASPQKVASPQTDDLSISIERILNLARIDAPPVGTGLQIHADFPATAPLWLGDTKIRSLTAEITPAGIPRVVNVVTSEARSQRRGPRGRVAECEDAHYAASGPAWAGYEMPITWYFNLNSVPDYLSDRGTLQAIRRGHRAWPRELTNCSRVGNNFHYRYAGDTDRGVDFDGQNTIDFAQLGRPLAVNYLWYSTESILEVDLRFNPKYRWTNTDGSRNAYHVINVATHELGHQLGLDDLGRAHATLTMFGQIGLGEVNKVTLGTGDLVGASQVSP
ncbi:MAG TPA: matrixin family metalloprotease [Actinomycetota bacterium]|nr:matrixin family metalloprotease [Actinomycetota bacterium]